MSRLLSAALALFSSTSILMAADGTDGSPWSGSYRGRVLSERFLHQQARSRDASSLLAEQQPRLLGDRGQIAVIDASGGVVAQPNFLDLQGASVRFRPEAGGYSGEGGPVDFDELARADGVPLALDDDHAQRVALPFAFPFFGAVHDAVFVNSDGNLTFGKGDAGTGARSLPRAIAGSPRIAPLFVDLDPSEPGAQVRAYVRSDRIIITWDGVPQFGRTRRHIFQTVLHISGELEFHYLSVNVISAVVGIFPGGGSSEPSPVDLSGSFVVGPAGAAELFQLLPNLDPMTAARRFYANHDDAYDFIFLFNNFNLSPGPGTFAFELNVRNHISGVGDVLIGRETFDFGADFGSPRRLSSFLNMGPLSAYPDDPRQVIPLIGQNTTLSVMGQEAGHRWGVYTEFVDPATGLLSDALLGRGDAHWSFFFNSRGSVMEGSDILDAGPAASPRFTTGPPVVRYSDFDQYIMGLRAPEEVSASFLVEQPRNLLNTNPGRAPQGGVSFDGVRKEIPIEAVIAAEGPRRPDHTVAQRSFNFAFVLLVDENAPPPSDDEIAKLDRVRREWEDFFEQTTDGRLEANTSLLRGLHLSSWPQAGVVIGKTIYTTLNIEQPLDRDLDVLVTSNSSNASTPGLVTIRAGETSAVLAITGVFPGTAVLRSIGFAPGLGGFDSPEAAISVLPASEALEFSIISGGDQFGTPSTPLPDPIHVRVTSQNGVPVAGVRLLALPGRDGSAAVLTGPTNSNGQAEIRWTLASAPGENELLIRAPGMAGSISVAAEAVEGLPVFSSDGVVNAASFAANGLSPGSIGTLFGRNLALSIELADGFPLARTLAGTQLFVDGVPAPLFYVSSTQINFQVPYVLPGPTALVSVVSPAGPSPTVAVPIASADPGIFVDPTSGMALIGLPADGLFYVDRAARAGESVELYCVGLGEVGSRPELGAPASGFFLSETVSTPVISLGGRVVAATFSGLAPGFAGLYQVNFQLPSDLPPGPYEVTIALNGVVSNTAFIHVE